VQSGQVVPFVTSPPADPAPAQRFNRMIVDHARAGRLYFALASPVLRTGVPVNDFALLTLAALFDGQAETGERAAEHALALLKGIGRRPLKEGRLLEDDNEARTFLAERMQPIIDGYIPIWRRLGMLQG
jgi:hypothetical protein